MKENKVLLRGGEEISSMIYPHMDIYNGSNIELNSHTKNLLEKEKDIIHEFTLLPSVREMLRLGYDEPVTFNNYGQLLENAKKDLIKKNLPVELLDFVYVTAYDESAHMLPNSILPISSILTLENAKNSFIYDGEPNITQNRWYLVDQYETKIKELSDCTDEKFVAKQLAPLQKKLIDFDKENVESLKQIKIKEDKFNHYLTDLGLKATYDSVINNPAEEVKTEMELSQNTSRKPKKTVKIK